MLLLLLTSRSTENLHAFEPNLHRFCYVSTNCEVSLDSVEVTLPGCEKIHVTLLQFDLGHQEANVISTSQVFWNL